LRDALSNASLFLQRKDDLGKFNASTAGQEKCSKAAFSTRAMGGESQEVSDGRELGKVASSASSPGPTLNIQYVLSTIKSCVPPEIVSKDTPL